MFRRIAVILALALLAIPGWVLAERGWTVLQQGSNDALAGPGDPDARQASGQKVVNAPPLQPPALEPAPGNPVVVVSTTRGDLTIELFKDRAPVSVDNFLQYARDGFYDGTIFHRVVPNFMIQGGGFLPSLAEKPTRPPIQNEATNGLKNVRGTVAMARRQPLRSATSQFYINVADNRMLDHAGYNPMDFGYAVFGRVLAGMEVADAIAGVPTTTTRDGMENVPVEPVVITSVRVKRP